MRGLGSGGMHKECKACFGKRPVAQGRLLYSAAHTPLFLTFSLEGECQFESEGVPMRSALRRVRLPHSACAWPALPPLLHCRIVHCSQAWQGLLARVLHSMPRLLVAPPLTGPISVHTHAQGWRQGWQRRGGPVGAEAQPPGWHLRVHGGQGPGGCSVKGCVCSVRGDMLEAGVGPTRNTARTRTPKKAAREWPWEEGHLHMRRREGNGTRT